MGNPFEDLRQAVVVRPMNSPGPQGAAAPHMKVKYSADGTSWHNDPVETDRYLSFSTDNGITWSDAIYFNNLSETLEWAEKARQWAINPENDPVENGQYSALHHALQAKKAEITAAEYVLDASELVAGSYGVAPPLWDSTTVYDYGDIVSFDNGHIYRCIGTNIAGVSHAPNINGIDNVEDWARITVVLDGYFEVDENGDFMPMIAPTASEIFMLDENGDIMCQDPIDSEIGRTTIEIFTIDENSDITYRDPTDHRPGGGNIELYKEAEFVDSIADLRLSSFYGTTKYVYVAGYYGAGTPGGGVFYRDIESNEADNGGTIIVDADGVRWKRANVHEEYYASWFGVSTEIEDNSPLIQRALDTVVRGGILIFGPGTYYCKQPIVFHFPKEEIKNAITIKGAAEIPSIEFQFRIQTTLQYVGPNPDVLTPFFDFRGTDYGTSYPSYKNFCGSIRNITFMGPGADSNIVGLWFHECQWTTLDGIVVRDFKYGIQVDKYFFNCKFNDITCTSCDCGFRGLGEGNGTVFNYCGFRRCNIGFYWGGGAFDGLLCFNNCFFELNQTAIKARLYGNLVIDGCYIEANHEYMIDIFCLSNEVRPLLSINNSFLFPHPKFSPPIKTFIKQNSYSTVSYDIRNNLIININTFTPYDLYIPIDYFIYAEYGNTIIKAENNRLQDPSVKFPICSVVPVESSYFNNDFTYPST